MQKTLTNPLGNIRKIVVTALLIAVGIVFPYVFHSIPGAAFILLPMHIPIFLCGLICGIPFGLVCGILTPFLSHFVSGMPGQAFLPVMMFELAAYGAVSGLLMRCVPVKNLYARSYVALIGAMLAGRIIFGVINAFVFKVGEHSVKAWVTAAFVTAMPGIVIQIMSVPSIVVALRKSSKNL